MTSVAAEEGKEVEGEQQIIDDPKSGVYLPCIPNLDLKIEQT